MFDQVDWVSRIDKTILEITRWESVRSWRIGCVHHKERNGGQGRALMINEPDKADHTFLDEADKSKLIFAISDHLDWQFE